MLQHDLTTCRIAAGPSQDWPSFTRRLAETLGALADGQYLILAATHIQRYVQFACCGAQGLRAEAVSNAYLPAHDQLGPTQLDALGAAGWRPPTHAPEAPASDRRPNGSVNHYADFEVPVPFDAVAELAVDTLANVFGIADPGQLEYEAFRRGGVALEFPGLGVARRPTVDAAATGEALAGLPVHAAELDGEGGQRAASGAMRQALLDALRDITGWGDLVFDDDGDAGLRIAGQAVFLRVVEVGPWVRLWSLLVNGVESTSTLLRRLNELNAIGGMRLRVQGGSIVAEHDLPADPLVPAVLAQALAQFTAAINGLDLLLRREFGGRLAPGRLEVGATRH